MAEQFCWLQESVSTKQGASPCEASTDDEDEMLALSCSWPLDNLPGLCGLQAADQCEDLDKVCWVQESVSTKQGASPSEASTDDEDEMLARAAAAKEVSSLGSYQACLTVLRSSCCWPVALRDLQNLKSDPGC